MINDEEDYITIGASTDNFISSTIILEPHQFD